MIAPTIRRVAIVAAASLIGTLLPACERSGSRPTPTDSAVALRTQGATDSSTVAPTAHDTITGDSVHMPTLADTVDPAVTVRAYLVRAMLHRASRDSMIWQPSADSVSGFRTFTDTTISMIAISDPGRMDGAAGSRYVTVPLTVGIASGQAAAMLHGTATLRRAVVDGATDAQRRWRIVRIDWSAR